jgi:dTMP kinase
MSLRFIVVDGLDGCGKDTHAERIRIYLEAKGEHVTVISHPSRRLFGRLSKRALEGSGPVARSFATLFFTADVLVSVSRLKRQSEGTVIFVRYLLGTAYLPERLAPTGYKLFRKVLPFPDIALFIDIDPQVAKRRISLRGHRHEMFETEEKLLSVRRVAKSLVADEWVTIDNSEDGENPFIETERVLSERFV